MLPLENEEKKLYESIVKIVDNYPNACLSVPRTYQYSTLFSTAIVGTESVGKSTFFSKLLNRGDRNNKGKLVETEFLKEGSWIDLISIIDTPSYDPENTQILQELVDSISKSSLIVQIFNADTIIRRDDKRLLVLIKRFEKPYLPVLNKVDLYNSNKISAGSLEIENETGIKPILVSAKTGEGMYSFIQKIVEMNVHHELRDRILDVAKRLEYINGQEVRRVARHNNCQKKISLHAHEAAKIGASKDSSAAVLLTLHKVMIYDISEEYSEFYETHELDINLENKVSFFINALAQELKKLPANVGTLITSAHAVVWTEYIGNMAIKYFEERVLKDSIKEEITAGLQSVLHEGSIK